MSASHDDAATALLRVRDTGIRVFSAISEAQPLAPHHLLALRAVQQGARSLGDVAEATGRHPSSTSRVIDQLVGSGTLDRSPDPDDRRQVVLRLTEEGERYMATFAAMDTALAARMMAELDDEDAALLARLLDRLAGRAAEIAAELEADPALLDEIRAAAGISPR